jgi:hypothetical protein
MSKPPSPTRRGDLMRQIAALHVQVSSAQTVARRQELQQQIAALTKQMMAP